MAETTTVVVPMPQMGVSVEEGTVVEWLVAVGDEVSAGQPLCAIATDKVDTEIEAPTAGVLARIVVQVDENVAVGAPLAVLETAGSTGEGLTPVRTAARLAPTPALPREPPRDAMRSGGSIRRPRPKRC